MRYYPPAKKCNLDSAWVEPYLVVPLAGWAVGVQLQPASPIILVQCQDPKKIPHPSGLVLWIDAPHLGGLPAPPHYCPGAPLSIPASLYRDPCCIIRRVRLWTYFPELMTA